MAVSASKAVYSRGGFDIDGLMTTGLNLFVRGGLYVHASLGLQAAASILLALTASATNYVEMDANGVISSNTTGFTTTSTSLYVVTTGTTQITGLVDVREIGGLSGLVDGAQVTNVANGNVVGVVPVVHRVDIAAGALGNTDVVLTHKTRVIDAFLILRGAGVSTTTLQVKNGTSAITNAMAASGSDQALVRAASIDDAAWEIAAGGTLRVTSATGATQPDAVVFVIGLRVA